MPCPTCDHTLSNVGERIFWCERCGTVLAGQNERDVYVPKLVERVRELRDTMKEEVGFSGWDMDAWHRLGIIEAIHKPSERPNQ